MLPLCILIWYLFYRQYSKRCTHQLYQWKTKYSVKYTLYWCHRIKRVDGTPKWEKRKKNYHQCFITVWGFICCPYSSDWKSLIQNYAWPQKMSRTKTQFEALIFLKPIKSLKSKTLHSKDIFFCYYPTAIDLEISKDH